MIGTTYRLVEAGVPLWRAPGLALRGANMTKAGLELASAFYRSRTATLLNHQDAARHAAILENQVWEDVLEAQRQDMVAATDRMVKIRDSARALALESVKLGINLAVILLKGRV